jgi:hypothetical protein
LRAKDNGAKFGDVTNLIFPLVGSSGVSHPHQTVQFRDELFVPDLVRMNSPYSVSNS